MEQGGGFLQRHPPLFVLAVTRGPELDSPMAIRKKSWEDTVLWKQLKQRAKKRSNEHEAAPEIISQIEVWMKLIEKVLGQGHTSPQDFTLHDHEHSFRVAERMMQLVPTPHWQHISDYEVALLLLAAYLHDIGMTPQRKKLTAIHRHLLTKVDGLLTEAEAAHFRRWLDENGHDFELPLCKGAPTTADLDRADLITAFYARHQHNEWSKEWIEQHLRGEFHFLTDWQATLILLCQSHHFDHQRLREHDFDPRSIGSMHPQRLHLRHLACILRVADILENDPERVPDIIFHHRDIASRDKSIIHWHIPHQMSITIHDGRVCVNAWPLSARAQKAIHSLADAIDSELVGCATIAEQHGFEHCHGLPDVKRDWPLAASASRLIQPKDNAYTYIDGAFRPNTEKLLQLLSGTQLYNDRRAAVRELLQNAFDAVREKIARKRLPLDDAADPKWETELGRNERVRLTLSESADGTLCLRCHDTGVGMTKEIIEKHLLVSGDAHRPAIIELERACEGKKFSTGRTGQFGIGVLSYFMMAKSVRIETCRDQLCHDQDGKGWTFTTTGVGDFGELREMAKTPDSGPGTIIEWRLDKEKLPDAKKLSLDLEKYLREQLIRIPCDFHFEVEREGKLERRIEFGVGWTHSHEEMKRILSAPWTGLETSPPAIDLTASAGRVRELAEISQNIPAWIRAARESLRISEATIVLPNHCGQARVVLPWFDLPEGPALAYLCMDREDNRRMSLEKLMLVPVTRRIVGWKGMVVPAITSGEENVLNASLSDSPSNAIGAAFFDFHHLSPAVLDVNRQRVSLNAELVRECRKRVKESLTALADDVLCNVAQPPFYGLLTDIQLGRPPRFQEGSGWLCFVNGAPRFVPISFPAFVLNDLPGLAGTFRLGGKTVSQLLFLYSSADNTFILSKARTPDRIAALQHRKKHGFISQVPAAVWIASGPQVPISRHVSFPTEWKDVVVVKSNLGKTIYNADHWAVKLVGLEDVESAMQRYLFQTVDWEAADLITTAEDAVLVLLRCLDTLDYQWHENLQTNRPGLLEKLFDLCAHAIGHQLGDLCLYWVSDQWSHKLTVQTYETQIELPSEWRQLIPPVTDPEWLIEAVEEPG